MAGLVKASKPSPRPISSTTSPLSASSTLEHDYDALIGSYGSLFSVDRQPAKAEVPSSKQIELEKNVNKAAPKDEWAGLF